MIAQLLRLNLFLIIMLLQIRVQPIVPHIIFFANMAGICQECVGPKSIKNDAALLLSQLVYYLMICFQEFEF